MDIGSHIGSHRQHRQWGGVRSTIEVPMLPMSAYVAAYVRFFVFLVACLCAYVLFPGLPFWAESWVSSQTLGKNITSTAPGAEKDRKATALSGTN